MTDAAVSRGSIAQHRRKVALLLPDLRPGGAERVNINLANEFVSRGYGVDLLLMRATGALLPLVDPEIRLVDLGAGRMRSVFRPLIRYMRQERPSSMLVCMWPLTVLAVAARAVSRTKIRLVLAEHTTWSASERSHEKLNWFNLTVSIRLAFPRSDAVVAVSEGAADDLASIANLPRHRVAAIYNPIVGGAKPLVAEELPESLDWAAGSHRKILAVGTLKAIKDYATLLRAFAILRKSVDAKLLILGEGEERGPLEKLVAELGIGGDVSMPGFVSSTEAYYRRAELHVLSSVGEGLPTVIVEALEQGVPVVSTDCRSGPREILDNGRFGSLVAVADPDALAKAMQDSLARTHDTAALKARAADFSVSKAVDAYLDLMLPGWRNLPSLPKARG